MSAPPRRSAGFLALYALANAGGVLAFLPLLTLLLPLKVEAMAAADRLGLLTAITLAGAVAASVSNIVAGALSDRTYVARGTRRPWIVAGLILTTASYAGIAAAATPASLLLAMVAYQTALNVMLAPLFAVMADAVPDAQKGVAGGLLALASPIGSFAGGAVTAGWLGEDGRLAAVCLLVAIGVVPLLVLGGIGPRPPRIDEPSPQAGALRRGDLALVWGARLCVQIAVNVLFTYLFFFFESVAGGVERLGLASRVGHLTGIAFAGAALVAFAAGRASDRWGARKPFLLATAAATAVALAIMASAGTWWLAVAGYALFACGSATFLGLHSAYAMQILPSARHRGRDLGLLNLTNTLPALVGPALTWTLATTQDFAPVLTMLAALTLVGGALVLPVRSER